MTTTKTPIVKSNYLSRVDKCLKDCSNKHLAYSGRIRSNHWNNSKIKAAKKHTPRGAVYNRLRHIEWTKVLYQLAM